MCAVFMASSYDFNSDVSSSCNTKLYMHIRFDRQIMYSSPTAVDILHFTYHKLHYIISTIPQTF